VRTRDGSDDASDVHARSPEYLLEPLSVLSDASTTLSIVLTTDQKCATAELAIARSAAALGAGVFKSLSDGERYDLIFDLRPNLLRVQCKWAALVGEVLVVPCRSCRRTRQGLLHRPYTTAEVDAIAGYCAELDRSYFVPIENFEGRSALQLRIRPARNNQRLGINWADQFAFEARLTDLLGP
jgi:hypothetical protein